MQAHRKLVAFGLAVMFLFSGCTTMLKERQVTKTRVDEEGLLSDVFVEQESAQHLSYRLFWISYPFVSYPPLACGNEWEIRRKEAILYRRTEANTGVREDREIHIQADNSFFNLFIAEELKRQHVEIFKYVMGSVDTDRRRTVRQAAIEDVFPENEFRWCAWVDAAAVGSGELDWHSKKGRSPQVYIPSGTVTPSL